MTPAWIVDHQDRVYFFDAPGPAVGVVALPPKLLAVGTGPMRASALGADGSVWAITPTGLERRRRVWLPGDVLRAGISADGGLLVVSPRGDEAGCSVQVLRGEAWETILAPDFLCAVTDVRCAADGQTFGYAWRTSQPWGDYGSYGSPYHGVVVLEADGKPLHETWDFRDDDESVRRLAAWGPAGNPLVWCVPSAGGALWMRGCTDVTYGAPPLDDPAPWNHGPAGSPERRGGTSFVLAPAAEVVRAVVSADGDVVGAVDADGVAWLLDRSRSAIARVAEGVIAMEVGTLPLVGVVTAEGIWHRVAIAEDAWERTEGYDFAE